MTMRYTKLLWTVALGVVCGCAAFAQNMFLNDRQQFVGTATITITGWGSANGQANVSSPPFSGVAGAGLFAINPPQQGTGYVACVDLANTINFGSTYAYEVWLARGRAGALAVLYDTINWNDAAQAVGFQLALWELVYDSYNNPANDDLFGGNFRVSPTNTTSGAIAAAQNFLSQIGNNTGPYFYLRAGSGQFQDLILVPYVPEPASMLALGAGLASLVGLRRRRAR